MFEPFTYEAYRSMLPVSSFNLGLPETQTGAENDAIKTIVSPALRTTPDVAAAVNDISRGALDDTLTTGILSP